MHVDVLRLPLVWYPLSFLVAYKFKLLNRINLNVLLSISRIINSLIDCTTAFKMAINGCIFGIFVIVFYYRLELLLYLFVCIYLC